MPQTTSPDNITYPVVGDNLNPLATWFANLATSVQNALTAQRAAVYGRATRTSTYSIGGNAQTINVTSMSASAGGVTLVSNGLRAPRAGLYAVNVQAIVSNANNNTYRDFFVQVNGTTVPGTETSGASHASSSSQPNASISTVVALAVGDIVTIGTNAGVSGTVQTNNNLSIALVRG